jgi:putative flippase GtrA
VTKKVSDKKTLFKQIKKFVVTGFVNTGIDFVVLFLLLHFTGKTTGIYTLIFPSISFSLATVNSFLMNKYWTFKGNKEKEKEKEYTDFGQFMVITLGGLGINAGITYLGSNFIAPFLGIGFIITLFPPESVQKFWVMFAKLIATCVSLVWNFVGYKFWVFKK